MPDYIPSSGRPFESDPELQAIAIGWKNAGMIADQALPRRPVSTEDFKYTKYDRSQLTTVPPSEVSRRGRVARVDFSTSTATASVGTYGLEASIPYSDIDAAAKAKAPNPEGLAVESMQQLIALDREKRCANLIFGPSTYAADHRQALAGEGKFSHAKSSPLTTLKAVLDTAKMPLNTMVIGAQAWAALSTHPELVSAYYRNPADKGIIPPEFLARLFDGVSRILIGRAWVNTAQKGKGEALARIWGPHIALYHLDPSPMDIGSATFGFTATYGPRYAGRWDTRDIGLSGGIVVRTGEMIGEIISARDYGYLIQDAV